MNQREFVDDLCVSEYAEKGTNKHKTETIKFFFHLEKLRKIQLATLHRTLIRKTIN